MATTAELLEKLVPSIISGAGTAMATVYGYLSDIKKRVTDLETRLGKTDPDTGSRSGLIGVLEGIRKKVESLEGTSDELVRQLADLEESVSTRKSFSSSDFTFVEDRIYTRVARDLQVIQSRVESLEKKIESLEGRLAQCQTTTEAQKERELREAALRKLTEKIGTIQGHIKSLSDLMEKILQLPKS